MSLQPRPILYVNPTSRMSGAEFSLLALMENLDRDRFLPLLVVPEEGMFVTKAREAGMETLILPSLVRFGEAYRVRTIPRASRAVWGLRDIIRKKGIRLVHSNSPRAAYLGGAAARLGSMPSVVHVRDIHLSPFGSALKARLLARLSDRIIAVSEAAARSVTDKTPSLASKVCVVYNGVDLQRIDGRPTKNARAELGIGSEDPLVTSVGILHPAKGQGVLLRAAAALKSPFPSLKVLIVGDPFREVESDYRRRLEDMTAELNLTDNVIFTGFREDALDLVNAADVFVHASIYPEPLPRSVLEAMALRKPTVATNVGGVPEIIEHGVTGLLVEPSDPAALADAVASLLKNRNRALRLGENGRKKVEKDFTIKKHVAVISDIYEGLLERS